MDEKQISKETMKKLFVYGTLKRGHGRHRVLEKSKFLGFAKVSGILYSLGMFPGIKLADKGVDLVLGELYEVSPDTIKELDWIEGHPNFFGRSNCKVFSEEIGWVDAITYEFKQDVDKAEIIAGGVW